MIYKHEAPTNMIISLSEIICISMKLSLWIYRPTYGFTYELVQQMIKIFGVIIGWCHRLLIALLLCL